MHCKIVITVRLCPQRHYTFQPLKYSCGVFDRCKLIENILKFNHSIKVCPIAEYDCDLLRTPMPLRPQELTRFYDSVGMGNVRSRRSRPKRIVNRSEIQAWCEYMDLHAGNASSKMSFCDRCMRKENLRFRCDSPCTF